MITRVRLASVAFLLLLASASVSSAQQSDSTSSRLHPGLRPHAGAVGGQVGVVDLLGGGDYSDGAAPRYSFTGSFRYVASPRWGWQIDPWYGWAGYAVNTASTLVDPAHPADRDKNSYLVQMTGASAQFLLFRTRGSWTWHLGAGPAVYRVWLENHRKVVKDPITFVRHRDAYLGATAEIGAEHFLKSLSSTSLEWTAGWHTAFAKDDKHFPGGYNDNPQFFEVRFGAHYYYDLNPAKNPGAKPAPKR